MSCEDCAVGAMQTSSVNASKKQNIDVILLMFVKIVFNVRRLFSYFKLYCHLFLFSLLMIFL